MKIALGILFFLFTTLLSGLNSKAQNQSSRDSLIVYMNSIHSKADSAVFSNVFDWIDKTTEDVLLKGEVMKQIYKLKNISDDRDYFDLVSAYQSQLIDINTKESNEKAIAIGKDFFEHYTDNKSRYGHYGYLWVFREMRSAYRNLGKQNESIEYYAKMERKFLAKNDSDAVSIANNVLSSSYFGLGISEKAIYHQRKSIAYLNDSQLDTSIHRSASFFGVAGKLHRYANLSDYYLNDKLLPEADSCLRKALKYYHKLDAPLDYSIVPNLFIRIAISKTLAGAANSQAYYDTAFLYLQKYKSQLGYFATYYQEKGVDLSRLGLLDSALHYFGKTIQIIDSLNLPVSTRYGQLTPDYYEAEVAIKKKDYAAAIKLLQRQLQKLENLNLRPVTIKALVLLAEAYAASGKKSEAFQSMQQAFALRVDIMNDEKEARTLSFEVEKQMNENELSIANLESKNRIASLSRNFLIGIAILFLLLALGLYNRFRFKKKANLILEQTLSNLKSTQSQLIQSEKMASLGELTAGIAHEIQNPLNFVNNFSEINTELIDELEQEVKNGNLDEVTAIARDIRENEQKINHHGKRADAIVKGMLQHSRASSGQKEPTDVNALADEYLRLSYHGLRAKDKSFNATLKTDFDENIGNINVVPQDIGRVILNLITNAFYAVDARKKNLEGLDDYEPTVSVTTKKLGNQVVISVKDNGSGIPEQFRDKIFQPFFTTKPTGEGTGLGLSLSYDIVKAHGGELKVDNKPGEGVTFTIILPIG